MINRAEIDYLRNTPSETVVERYSNMCNYRFDPDGIPVVIAARNEQADLPATLVSLASSEYPLAPIVVENGSHDKTTEYAERMGALVLHSSVVGKMAALQAGITHVQETTPHSSILLTDADTLVGPRWATRMMTALSTRESPTSPAVACGMALIAHGPSRRVDAAITTYVAARELVSLAVGKTPVAWGCNMAVAFDNQGKMADDLQALHPQLFTEDIAIRDIAMRNGGEAIRVAHPDAWVATKGDRYTTLRDCLKTALNRQHMKDQYAKEYGALVQYSNQ